MSNARTPEYSRPLAQNPVPPRLRPRPPLSHQLAFRLLNRPTKSTTPRVLRAGHEQQFAIFRVPLASRSLSRRVPPGAQHQMGAGAGHADPLGLVAASGDDALGGLHAGPEIPRATWLHGGDPRG